MLLCGCRASPLQAYLFERLRLGVPGVAGELLAHRHRLLAERGCMEQVVRQYNRLLLVLSKDERRLFKDRIRWAGGAVMLGQGRRGCASGVGRRWQQRPAR